MISVLDMIALGGQLHPYNECISFAVAGSLCCRAALLWRL